MELVTTAHPDHPELDMSFSGELLQAVARGEAGETIRVFRPGPTVAFGRLDRLRPGFQDASRVAFAHGRAPLVRWGGGHAVAYDHDSLIVEILRAHEPHERGLEARFVELAALIERALSDVGVNVEAGELPGEYCPGRYSLHLREGPKVAGVAQRVIARASLTTAVVVVGGGEALRTVLADVYAALELPIDLRTVGAVSDRYPAVGSEQMERAIIERLAATLVADGGVSPA